MSSAELPHSIDMANNRVLICEQRGQPLTFSVESVPEAIPGSAVIEVLAFQVSSNANKVFRGDFPWPLKTPFTPSAAAIGRVHDVGTDAATLRQGQLILCDFCITARDDGDVKILQGFLAGGPSAAGLETAWPTGTYAQYARVPLENCWALQEELLTKQLGYSFAEMVSIGTLAVPHAGLQEIGTQPGETVIVAPATGFFGGCGVRVAIALGARVIAVGRNGQRLSQMASVFESTGRLKTVTLSGDMETDTEALSRAAGSAKGADKYLDFSPPESAGSKHIESCLRSLRPGGKCVMMGAVFSNVDVPYAIIVQKSLTLQGRFMFFHHHAKQTINLVETGLLKLGPRPGSGMKMQCFNLDEIQNALDQAEKDTGWDKMIVGCPDQKTDANS